MRLWWQYQCSLVMVAGQIGHLMPARAWMCPPGWQAPAINACRHSTAGSAHHVVHVTVVHADGIDATLAAHGLQPCEVRLANRACICRCGQVLQVLPGRVRRGGGGEGIAGGLQNALRRVSGKAGWLHSPLSVCRDMHVVLCAQWQPHAAWLTRLPSPAWPPALNLADSALASLRRNEQR